MENNYPLALRLEDASNELKATVEDISKKYGLPCYLLTPIVSEVLVRLENGKRVELENARLSYEQKKGEKE